MCRAVIDWEIDSVLLLYVIIVMEEEMERQ